MVVWMERELRHSIIHAVRNREYRIAGTPVDGNQIIERDVAVMCYNFTVVFDCPNCYQINRERKLMSGASHTIDARYERTFAMICLR